MATNAPESESLTLDDVELFENARIAIATTLRRTFDAWNTIGRAVVRAREIADRRGGGKTFMRLIEQQGLLPALGRNAKGTASKLERIMSRLMEVEAWRETLTDHQRIEWSSPTSVLARCPAFMPAKKSDGEPDTDGKSESKPLSKLKQTEQNLAEAIDREQKLAQRLAKTDGGNLFDINFDTVEHIATTIAATWKSPGRLRQLGEALIAQAKEWERRRKSTPIRNPVAPPEGRRTHLGRPVKQ